jgi:hypothetical protein
VSCIFVLGKCVKFSSTFYLLIKQTDIEWINEWISALNSFCDYVWICYYSPPQMPDIKRPFLRIYVCFVLFADLITWSPVLPPPKHSSYIVQVSNETGRQVYACPICGGQYKFRASLNCHMQTHKIQPMCHICHTVLNRKYDLKRHLRNVHKIDD